MLLKEGVDGKEKSQGKAFKEMVEGIKIGHAYEIDRSSLPQASSADLKAARVVMVSKVFFFFSKGNVCKILSRTTCHC